MAKSKLYYSVAIMTEKGAQPTVDELVKTLTALTNQKITEAKLPGNKSAYRVDVMTDFSKTS